MMPHLCLALIIFVLLMVVLLLELLILEAGGGGSLLTENEVLFFLSWVEPRVISPLTLGNGHVIFNSINQKSSLTQGGPNVCFMIELNFFEIFQLSYDFPVVVGQTHAIRGLLQIESLNDDSGITYDSQLLNG